MSARHSARLLSNLPAQTVKATLPLHHTDRCVDFDWLHQSLSGLFWSGWLRPPHHHHHNPSLGSSDRSCCGWKSGLFESACPLGANWETSSGRTVTGTHKHLTKVVASSSRLRLICRNFQSLILHKDAPPPQKKKMCCVLIPLTIKESVSCLSS